MPANSPAMPRPTPHSAPVRRSNTLPLELRATSAATVTPFGSTTLAEPMPPLRRSACEPVPAPTLPWRTARVVAAAVARRPNSASGWLPKRPPTPRSNSTAAGTIGTTWWGSGADREPAAALGQPGHHAGRRGEPVGAAARQAHRVDALDDVDRVERVGLTRPGPAAAHVDAADRSRRRQDHGRAGEPAAAGALVVADRHAGDIGEVVVRTRRHDGGHRCTGSRKRSAAATYTLACSTRSATSTNSSAWWAIHLPPGP